MSQTVINGATLTGAMKDNIEVLKKGYTTMQLDWTFITSQQKINLPANQKGYDTFETTVGKPSVRRIQICFDYFLFRPYFEIYNE